MKVLHFVMGRLSLNTSNGVNKIVHGLCKYMIRDGHDIKVIGLSNTSKDKRQIIQRDGFEIEVFNSFRGACFDSLKKAADEADIVHLNSVWNHYNFFLANYLIKNKIPYVITVHGGLFEDRVMQSKYRIKLLYNKLIQRRIFEKADGVQTNSLEESTAILKYISNHNNFTIGNGLDLDFPEIKDPNVWNKNPRPDSKVIHCGYLGRLSVEKNVDGLIDAINLLPAKIRENLKCHLIGPDNTQEAKFLKSKMRESGLEETVIFTGAKYGDEKYDFLTDLDFYVHPAKSEGFSIAVLEALYSKTPCIITRTCNVSYYQKTNSFIMAEPYGKDLARAIEEMIERRDEWVELGNNARALIETRLNWQAISRDMINAYQKLIDDKITS